jgi:hypothetical protein
LREGGDKGSTRPLQPPPRSGTPPPTSEESAKANSAATEKAVENNSLDIEALQDENIEMKMTNARLVEQLLSLSQRLQSLESSSDASSSDSTHSSKSSGRLCADDLRQGTNNISFARSPYSLHVCALSDVHLHDQPHPPRNVMPDIFELSPPPNRDIVPHSIRMSDASAEPLVSITMPPSPLRSKLPLPLRTRSQPVLTNTLALSILTDTRQPDTRQPIQSGELAPPPPRPHANPVGSHMHPATSIRPHLMSPGSRIFITDEPVPHTSQRARDQKYRTDLATVTVTSPDNNKSILKFITDVKPVVFDGVPTNWPPVEDAIQSFLRAHGISHVLKPGYKQSAGFNVNHNQALYKFLFLCVSKTPAVYAVLRRAPMDDGHTGFCYLSQQYGVRDPAALQLQIQFFTPFDQEKPMAAALRLEDLYNSLSMAGKPTDDWERIDKLLFFLEDFPKGDYGSVCSRIEDQATQRGMTYAEAVSWLGKREIILDRRAARADIVPRSRPTYIIHNANPASPPANGGGSADAAASSTETPGPPGTQAFIPPASQAFIAATQRTNPDDRKRREPCPQTPGLHLHPVARECRAMDCKAPTRSRLCEEHFLQLQARKAKFLVCAVPRRGAGGDNPPPPITKYAHYVVQAASGDKKEWRGVLFRDAEAHAEIMKA